MRTAFHSVMTPVFNNGGFTLIELLVVVLIIGILVAVALPQYQKAVLKSRYSAMMPIGKAIAEGNEIHYMEHGQYTNQIDQLDITYAQDMNKAAVSLSSQADHEDGFDYVLAKRSDLPGLAYVVYQNHSEQFPGTIMCEANDTLNSQATWLCSEGLKGRLVPDSLQGENWQAYLLKGDQGTSHFSACTGEKPASIVASSSGATGVASCNNETGQYEYTWTGGKEYTKWQSGCSVQPYDSGYPCAGSILSGEDTYCVSKKANSCQGSVFTGVESYCTGFGKNACAGTTIQGGAYCVVAESGGCNGAKFTTNTTGGTACCRENGGTCPIGVPRCYFAGNTALWDMNKKAVKTMGWYGNCCDPNLVDVCPTDVQICS